MNKETSKNSRSNIKTERHVLNFEKESTKESWNDIEAEKQHKFKMCIKLERVFSYKSRPNIDTE